ncbi:MAG: hypothetical protein H0Z37_10995 [Firmicutes bacterium]|nr:hypothetical protein [Bacillota bacterium]
MNPFTRAAKTAAAGGVGYLGGILLEHGIEALTGMDFVDGVLAVAGALVGAGAANRDMIEAAARQIERRFGVPAHMISKEQWDEWKKDAPRYAAAIEKALAIRP